MKKTPFPLLMFLLAFGLAAPTQAAPAHKAGAIPSMMITEVPKDVDALWRSICSFIQAWAAGDAKTMNSLMARNIEAMQIDVPSANNEYAPKKDVDRDDARNALLIHKDFWKEYELLQFVTTTRSDTMGNYIAYAYFRLQKNEQGADQYAEFQIWFRDDKINLIMFRVTPYNAYDPKGDEDIPLVLIKGAHFSSNKPEEKKEQATAPDAAAALPGNTCAWDGVDKDFSKHKLVAQAKQRTIVYNVAPQYIADYCEMRQDGAERYDKLIGDKVYLLGQDKTITGEEFKKLLGKGYLVWPQDTWPIRAGAQGSLVEFITRVIAPGFEEPIFLKTTMIIKDSHIEAIGETQCVKMEREVSGKRLPDVEYETLTKSGPMRSYLQNIR